MFSNVRWQIALWFVGLSAAAYLVPTGVALVVFYISLTNDIDRELEGFIGSFGHAISIVHGKPTLREWARVVQTHPAHSLVSYQLFDQNGLLLESHYPEGIPILFRNEHEVTGRGRTMRTRMTVLKEGDRISGFLQAQLPTRSRDEAMNSLAIITAIVAPVVLLGLGWSSYLVSEKATIQTRKTLAMLRQFMADASHELYTPLSIVQAATESLARMVAPNGLGAAELEASESALDRMEKMLQDLTLLSTMESPEAIEKHEPVELSTLLEGIISEFRPKFDQKKVELSLAYDEKIHTRGSQVTLGRMFANIVENAYRYTNPDGKVKVTMSRDMHYARISISDTGIGIPKEKQPHIFERFFRVDASRSRTSGGSGLGLAIALAIAHSHGGTIEAESELGKGSTFRVLLPVEDNS